MLGVLDAEAAIGFAVQLDYVGIQIEDGGDTLVANGVGANLQAGGVGFQ